MTIRFCFWCGTGYNRDSWKENYVCSVCLAIFKPPLALQEPQIDLEEAKSAFDKIPLTDKKAVLARRRRGR